MYLNGNLILLKKMNFEDLIYILKLNNNSYEEFFDNITYYVEVRYFHELINYIAKNEKELSNELLKLFLEKEKFKMLYIVFKDLIEKKSISVDI